MITTLQKQRKAQFPKLIASTLLTLLLASSTLAQVDHDTQSEPSEVFHSLQNDLNDLFGQSKSYLAIFQQIGQSLPNLNHLDFLKFQNQSNTLKEQILHHFVSICLKFADSLQGQSKLLFQNSGCSVLFQNVNNGIEDMIIAKRLTSHVVEVLNEVKDNTLNQVLEEQFLKAQNELAMSKIHKNAENCKFKLSDSDCLNAKGVLSSLYIQEYQDQINQEESQFQKQLAAQMSNFSDIKWSLFGDNQRNLMRYQRRPYQQNRPQTNQNQQSNNLQQKQIQNSSNSKSEFHANHHLCFRQHVKGILQTDDQLFTEFLKKDLKRYQTDSNFKDDFNYYYAFEWFLEEPLKKSGSINDLSALQKKAVTCQHNYLKLKSLYPNDYTKFLAFQHDYYKQIFQAKRCFNKIKLSQKQLIARPYMNGVLNLKYCSDAQLSFINFVTNGSKACSSIYDKPYIILRTNHKVKFFKQYKLEFFIKLFEEKEQVQHSRDQLKLQIANSIKKIQSSQNSQTEKLNLVKILARSTYLLETKKLPKVNQQNSLQECQRAHKDKECVDVQSLNYPFDSAIRGASVNCGKGQFPAWTKQSYQCQIQLKPNSKADAFQAAPNLFMFGDQFNNWERIFGRLKQLQQYVIEKTGSAPELTDDDFKKGSANSRFAIIQLYNSYSSRLQQKLSYSQKRDFAQEQVPLGQQYRLVSQQQQQNCLEFFKQNGIKYPGFGDYEVMKEYWLKVVHPLNKPALDYRDKLARMLDFFMQKLNPGTIYQIINPEFRFMSGIQIKENIYDPLFHTPYQWTPNVGK